MNNRLLSILTAGLVFVACASTPNPPRDAVPDHEPQIPDPAESRVAACLDWRWVGVKDVPDAPCPTAGSDWRVSHLFAPSSTEPEEGDEPFDLETLPSRLRAFCLYERLSAGEGRARQELMPLLDGGLQRIDPDCMAVTAMGPRQKTWKARTWQTLRTHFLEQSGQVFLPDPKPGRVRLAFLDTSATRDDGVLAPGNSLHGYTLTHLARELLCPGAENACERDACATRITTRLALPYVSFDAEDPAATVRDELRGGYFGTVSELARAVRDEVAAWSEDSGIRLILNLSAAWDGRRFGGLQSEVECMPAPVQAAYRALEDAACHGALTVAAAGNRKAGSWDARGPLLPAAWETRFVPEGESCRSAPGEPLVYAVGGVDSIDRPLVNSRLDAVPPRVAYGDHAVAFDPALDRPTAVYTGTSVATAVVAATAAAVWQYRPGFERHQVMGHLAGYGDHLGQPGSFPYGTQVSRISLCSAVAPLHGWPAGHCARQQQFPKLGGALGSFAGKYTVDLTHRQARTRARSISTAILPEEVEPAGCSPSPWPEDARTDPQPQNVPCPTCTLVGKSGACGDLMIEIAQDFTWGPVHATDLNFGASSYALNLTLQPGESAVVQCVQPSGDSATVTFQTQKGTIENPVLWALQ